MNDVLLSNLLEKNLISKDIFEKTKNIQSKEKTSLIEILINLNVPFDSIKNFFKNNYNIDYYSLSKSTIDKNVIPFISYDIAIKYNVFPVKMQFDTLLLAMDDPLNMRVLDDIIMITNLNITPVLSNPDELKNFINLFYRTDSINSIESQFLFNQNIKNNIQNDFLLEINTEVQNAPAVKLIDSLIESAVLFNASDIHIEPYSNIIRTRYRIDGCLKEFEQVDISLLSNIISRLKIMSSMDISEKRFPQDGHFKREFNKQNIDFRVSTIPTIFGEKAVIRLIYSENYFLDKNNLGFFKQDVEILDKVLKNPYGAILVTGPTGSGKTTTLYSFINQLNKEELNIVTIEDPVENIIFGINQININKKAGLDFSNALGFILRQDPDIIMIGEIRDNETANIALGASITGHLVLSTLHTNDSISTIIRLINMGIKDFLVASAVRCIISQRLVRKLCSCKKGQIIDDYSAKILNIKNVKVYNPCGCEKCNFTGYKGRFAVYELLVMDEFLINLIEKKTSQEDIRNALKEKGFKFIWDCLYENVILGNTSAEEMIKVVFLI